MSFTEDSDVISPPGGLVHLGIGWFGYFQPKKAEPCHYIFDLLFNYHGP